MKLVRVKVEYSCGLTIVERATLEIGSGQVHLPPRLVGLMGKMEETEVFSVVSVEYDGHVLPVSVSQPGAFVVNIPSISASAVQRLLHAIAYPSKDQRQQNGRFLHTLAAAAIGGAVATLHTASISDWPSLVTVALLGMGGVLLWFVGFRCMNGE
jgi:hypothetical protein